MLHHTGMRPRRKPEEKPQKGREKVTVEKLCKTVRRPYEVQPKSEKKRGTVPRVEYSGRATVPKVQRKKEHRCCGTSKETG